MFRNFIYFIVVLLIYTTYQPSSEPNFKPFDTFLLFVGLFAVFSALTWMQFDHLKRRASQDSLPRLDHKFNLLVTRQAVSAIILFTINVYGLSLPSYLAAIELFARVPTLQALLFLGLFVVYLSIVWFIAHGVYEHIYHIDIPRKSYVASNILFALPVLLPWFFLSLVADIIHVLPFDFPKRALSTTEGQVLYFLIFLFAAAIFGPALVQKFWRCKPLENNDARTRIESLCKRAELEYANILYWPIFGGRLITAGVMGLTRRFRYILVTDALLRYLEPDEIDAVIAHEIGHVKKKHLVFYLFFFVGYLLISYALFDLMILSILYTQPLTALMEIVGVHQTTLISAMFSVVIVILFLIYFRYVFGYFMRNFERQADTYVYTLFNDASSLIRTLEKISLTTGQPPERPNWHHFSISERIDYLKKCEQNRAWISRHNGKVRKSIAAYLIGIMLIAAAGYQLNFGETGRLLNAHFIEKIFERELKRSPNNARLYGELGNFYYSRKKYVEAIWAYEKAISLEMNSPETLNNLAWLYATCEDPSLRKPKRALVLAEKASSLEKSPHILDTLAESYYVNGMREEAIAAGKQALELARDNRSYYEKQLEKFMKK
ncbi:MAG: M48 family metalloprotease [Deltaproteobacteria bacterium]|nr:M48 family metalloprotease [Deltaproteobacteria bacterium]MBW2154635.1 M48 family metalloprotease [Deltaproteobacteria bacterium]